MMTSGSNAPRAASASASFVPARAVVRCPSPSNSIASISRTSGSSSTIRIAPVGPAIASIRFASAWQPLLVLSERHLYGEDRPVARPGVDLDGVAQEVAYPLHD